MKSKPRNHKAERPVLMYRKDIEKLQTETQEAALVLMLAYLMDEEDFDDERVRQMWQKMESWMLAVKDHLVAVEEVKKIIFEQRGWVVE